MIINYLVATESTKCYESYGFVEIPLYAVLLTDDMARTVAAKPSEKVQFNIRVDAEVLARFRDYCRRNGLDPQGQIVLFMRRVLDAEFDFQERLWSALKAETP